MQKPLVIKIGGAGVDAPLEQRGLWQALLEAHAALAGRLVLVHGGGRAVDAHLERLGFTTTRVEGLRVTPMEQVDEIVGVLAGRVNKALVAAINLAAPRDRAPAVGLCLADGAMLPTRVRGLASGADLGRVGEPDSHDDRRASALLDTLMAAGFLPVVSSIGYGSDGLALNVNADDGAAGLARALGARGLVLMTDVPAVLDAAKRPIASLRSTEIERLIADGTISGGMVPKVRAAVEASRSAGAPAYIASWSRPEDVVALSQGRAAGTRIEP